MFASWVLASAIAGACAPLSVCVADDAESMQLVQVGGHEYRVRSGYELTQVAGADLVTRPTVCDWDNQGRLVVCESSGTHESTEDQLTTKPHKLVRLIDDDGDGVFDRRIVAAEDLSFYSGVLCDGNDIYVSTPPSIMKLTDADGDGVCESREVWHDGGTITYCANDLHGPYKGPDGWIYWCKGAFGEQVHQLAGGETLTSKASHVLRKRPAGGPVEIVISGGMDNPIELAFLPTGDKFFTSTFLQYPSGGKRDGIGHAVYGSLFGKRHDVIDGHLRTGDLMPVMTQLGPAAPSGLTRLSFGNPGSDALVCAQFNLHKLSRHTLVPDGATFRTVDEDLVATDRLDFHPTDVIEDTDGSLLFLDTGDWYDLCCPSSGAEGSRAIGGVFRLSRVDAAVVEDPRGTSIDWNAMTLEKAIDQLGDDRPFVRESGKNWLVSNESDGVPVIETRLTNEELDGALACELVWVASRLSDDVSPRLLQQFLGRSYGGDAMTSRVHVAALNAMSVVGSSDLTRVIRLLRESDDAHVRRAAAECLGRHGDAESMAILLDQFGGSTPDRTLSHSLLYAILELDDVDTLVALMDPAWRDSEPAQLAAGLLAIDQQNPALLDQEMVFQSLEASDAPLRELAVALCERHPEWASELTANLSDAWSKADSDPVERSSLLKVIAAWQDQPTVQDWLGQQFASSASPESVLELITSTQPKSLPESWDAPLAAMMGHADAGQRRQWIAWLAGIQLTHDDAGVVSSLMHIVNDESMTVVNRLDAGAALPGTSSATQHGLSRLIVDGLLESPDSDHRNAAVTALQRLQIDEVSAKRLQERLAEVPVAHLTQVAEALVRFSDASASDLLNRLPEIQSARTIPADVLVSFYANAPQALQAQAKMVAEKLSEPPAEIAASLSKLKAELPSGDMVRGMRVFHGAKAACGSCHEFGDVGGRVGPELTGIGKSRSSQALLEAIVYPSSHIAQGYRSVKVLTLDGIVHNGLITRETSNELELITGINRTVQIAKVDIELREESDVSVMPAGLDGSLSKQELADVMELLKVYSAW